MDLIMTDPLGRELRFCDDADLDLDIGDTNDFVYSMRLEDWNSMDFRYGSRIFIPGTEYGGIIQCIKTVTKNNIIELSGTTWRGMLEMKIIEPPIGKEYLIVSGELNYIIEKIIDGRFGGLISVPTKSTGITITYQFDRYTSFLQGIIKMLATVTHRLQIKYCQGEPGESGYVSVEAVPIVDSSETAEYNQDCKIYFSSIDNRMGINHLICAGEGEGVDRTVLHLYVDNQGEVGEEQYYFGVDERTDLYSYTSQNDIEQLKKDGIERLKSLMDYKQFDMTVEDVNLEIGDIVSGRDRVTGTLVQQPIVNKILKIQGSKVTIDYKLKGDG